MDPINHNGHTSCTNMLFRRRLINFEFIGIEWNDQYMRQWPNDYNLMLVSILFTNSSYQISHNSHTSFMSILFKGRPIKVVCIGIEID